MKTFSQSALGSHAIHRFIHLDPPGSLGPGELVIGIDEIDNHAALTTAPSMTTPEVTYFQRATRSLRARATIVGFFRRPPFALTRSRNHWLRTEPGWWRSHSQAN